MNKSLITAAVAVAMLASGAASAQPNQGGRGQGNQYRHSQQQPNQQQRNQQQRNQQQRNQQQRNQQQRSQQQSSNGCYQGESASNCRERLRVQQRSRRQYVYRDGRYEPQDNTGAAFAGGILGFILGAAIAGSSNDQTYYDSHRNDRGWRYRCARHYRSFDYRTGTYLGYDGYRHYCTL